jgi:two-component system sensor histidine kinase SenX3
MEHGRRRRKPEDESVTEESDGLKRRLAAVIGRCRDEIVSRWLAAVSAKANATGVPLTALRDALPDYLDRLRTELSAGGSVRLEESAGAAWRDVAQEHALTRVRLGFDITQLIYEFVALRRVMFEVATREGVLDAGTSPILAELIEAGIAVSVRSYVDARDYDARRRQAANVGFITHELRNPLNAAMLAAERVREDAIGGSSRALDSLDRNLGRMRDLIDSVLESARSESEAIECRAVATTLGEIFADPLSTAYVQARRKGLELNTDFDPTTELQVDPDLTRSAVQNLLENAVKYTREGRVELSVDEEERQIVIHVRDSCPGISQEELATIFEPFRRGSTGTKGTGLGLTIAKRAVVAQGGRIDAESVEDRGCHFWITLPRHVER